MGNKSSALVFIVIVTAVLALASISASSGATQRNQTPRNKKGDGSKVENPADLKAIITRDNVRNLPAGDTRLVQEVEGDNAGSANGGVWKLTNGGQSVGLVKFDTGTLILPSASKGGITKFGSKRLILQSDRGLVYEFRGLGAAEFGQIFFQNEPLNLNGAGYLPHHRPEGSMKGWPFTRLLIGPATGIAQVEGWKTGKPPVSKYVCTGGSCTCSGTVDCLNLVNSGSCSSNMNCDGSGSNTKCYCEK